MADIRNWRKSTRSNGAGGNCVEIGSRGTRIGVRDSKDRDGGVLLFDESDWAAFVAGL